MERFFPCAVDRGFAIDKHHQPRSTIFRRHAGTRVEMFEVVLPTWCPDRGTLQPRRGASIRSWFRQDSTLLQRLLGKPALRQPAKVVGQLLELFPELERYWARGEVGPHLRLWPTSAEPKS